MAAGQFWAAGASASAAEAAAEDGFAFLRAGISAGAAAAGRFFTSAAALPEEPRCAVPGTSYGNSSHNLTYFNVH